MAYQQLHELRRIAEQSEPLNRSSELPEQPPLDRADSVRPGVTFQEALKDARKEFSSKLWQQPVTVMQWNDVGAGRYVVSFVEWYHYDKVRLMASLNVYFFNMGAVALLLSLGIYTEAHLRREENDDEANSKKAVVIFWVVLAGTAALGGLIEFANLLWPAPYWRDDIRDYAKNATKNLVHKATTESELNERNRRMCRLISVNVSGMEQTFKKLFKVIDFDDSQTIEFTEVCTMLGFNPRPIPVVNRAGERVRRRAGSIHQSPKLSPENEGQVAKAQEEIRGMLQKESILQEAILKLVQQLIVREGSFKVLYSRNKGKALAYLNGVIRDTRKALHSIETGVARRPDLKRSLFCCKKDEEWQSVEADGVSRKHWDDITKEILQELFF